MVKVFLRGQNLEQLGRADESIELYESVIASRFDSVGPYDRLIMLYSQRAQHADVRRVCAAALENVRTYQDKKEWYVRIAEEARVAATKVPRAAPKRK